MLKLNHMNLTTADVPGLTSFFERCFDFKVTERRGSDKFAVLKGETQIQKHVRSVIRGTKRHSLRLNHRRKHQQNRYHSQRRPLSENHKNLPHQNSNPNPCSASARQLSR
jgi:hypothetical protein